MKNRLKHFYLITAISAITIILFACNWSTKSYSIENKVWDVCVKTDFANPKGNCNYLITYVFDMNGTFYEYSKFSPDSIQNIQSSRVMNWKVEGNHLKISVEFENFQKDIEHEINWVNHSKFYTVEKNSFDVTTETWYEATDEIKN